MATRPLRILLVGAHPADCFDQAGGTLAHHAAQGDRVTVATLTTGVRSHDWRLGDEKRRQQEGLDVEPLLAEAVARKLDEVRSACRVLGFEDVRTLGFEDDEMLLTRDMVEAIADLIREVAPDVIITHHPYEGGGFKMHATAGQGTLYAWQQAMGSGRGRAKRHHAPALFFMNPTAYMAITSLQYASTSRVDLLVDITDVVDKKVQAMDMIETQYYGGAYARKAHECTDGNLGQVGDVAYAEAFQSFLPRVVHRLPVSDADLHRASVPSSETMARRSEIIASLTPMPPGHEYTSRFRTPKELYDA